MPLDLKQQRLLTLAKKGGTDPELMLLDLIHELEAKLEAQKKELTDKVDSTVKQIEAIPNPLSVELKGAELVTIKGEKGEKGDTGEKGETGPQGERGSDGMNGKDGRDGVNGEPPVKGIDYFDGRDGRDGVDGKDGKDFDPKLIEALEKKLIKQVDDRKPFQIFGPGKTKVFLIDLSSQLDGVTKTFSIGNHFGITGVWASSAPFGAFRPIVDYTEIGRNIVFTSNVDASLSLNTGQSLIIQYLK